MKHWFLLPCAAALLLAVAPSAQAEPAERSTSPMFLWATTTEVSGSQATLTRNDNGVSFTINTSGLEPGSVATVWWVVFNVPSACVDGCGVDDLFRPETRAWMGLAAGHVIGGSGNANYGGGLTEGDLRRSDGPAGGGPGLEDARAAEIHLVIRTHGAALTGQALSDQIHSFGLGCNPTCANVQMAAFLP